MIDDIYIDYLKWHYENYGTINNIPYNYTVNFGGKTLNIYSFLKNIKNRHKAYLGEGCRINGSHSAISIKRYEELEKLNIDWHIPSKKNADDVLNERQMRFLRKYFEENGTINDILYDMEVEFEGQILKIGTYLRTIRERHAKYVSDSSLNYKETELFITRYNILDEMHFDWQPRKKLSKKKADNELYLQFLGEHFQEYGTINDLNSKSVVTYQGEELKIGLFLENSRLSHRNFLAGKDTNGCNSSVMIERYDELDKMHFVWEPQPHKVDTKGLCDPYMDYLAYHYQTYGTINNIKRSMVVTYNGLTLNIGDFLCKMRSNYQHYQNGDTSINYATDILLARYKKLAELDFQFVLEEPVTAKKIALEHGVSLDSLLKLKNKFNGDMDKALKFALLKKESSKQKRNQHERLYTVDNVLKEFDIDFNQLISFLNHTTAGIKRSKALEYRGMSLREFCLQNGYNYDVVLRAVKLKMKGLSDENLDSLIDRSILEYTNRGQNKVSNWVYSKYGNELLVRHLFLIMGFSSDNILKDMSKNGLTLDEALMRESFRKNNRDRQFDHLRGLYENFIQFYKNANSSSDYSPNTVGDDLVAYAFSMIEEYHLSYDEFEVIRKSFVQYTDAIYQYRLVDVGFEKDNEKRRQKIMDYEFDEADVEKAFFMPLNFDEKVLVGRNSELYQRRCLLRDLTINWGSLSEEEKAYKISTYGITALEEHYIRKTRNDIDQAKVFCKK